MGLQKDNFLQRFYDFDKLLQASTGKNGHMVASPDLGRGELSLNELYVRKQISFDSFASLEWR